MSMSFNEALYTLTADNLKRLALLITDDKLPSRKIDLVETIEKAILSQDFESLWKRLDDVQQLAVREAMYARDNKFDAVKFQAKYGILPNFGTRAFGEPEKPSPLRLFLYDNTIPRELRQRLTGQVPPPDKFKLNVHDSLPQSVERSKIIFEWPNQEESTTSGQTAANKGSAESRTETSYPAEKLARWHEPLLQRAMDYAAQQDLKSVLRLIDSGKIAISDKSLRTTTAGANAIRSVLNDGDFLDSLDKPGAYASSKPILKRPEEGGSIKAFAWPMILQAAGLAVASDYRLTLTVEGLKALNAPAAETLKMLWKKWMASKMFDEFRRIDAIKGQSGKNERFMTSPLGRRSSIVEVLKSCPPGKWIQTDEFFRFMQATGFTFDVTNDVWTLYVLEPEIGILGYEESHPWSVLQGRYVLAFLFEYVATLGLIDVAYTHPANARDDFHVINGTHHMNCLSRYDGLMYFKLNTLGAYILDLSSTFEQTLVRTAFSVSSNLILKSQEEPSRDEILLLEAFADQEAPFAWRLNKVKALASIERGQPISQLADFLQDRDDQALPETVEAFIRAVEQQANALRITAHALFIECVDDQTAQLLSTHPSTKKLCMPVGERGLVVLTNVEAKFRKAINALGVGMPRVELTKSGSDTIDRSIGGAV